jgi:3-hydroxybutyryl-CoA dehydrogenase
MSIQRAAVIGAGTMGRGIAHVAAAAGLDVALHDVSDEALEKGLAAVRADLETGIEKGKLHRDQAEATLSRLRACSDFKAAVAGADLVVEAVFESLPLKRELFARLERAAPEGALLASNTSSLSVTRIAEGLRRAERVIGLHFFNPVHLMPLLEIVRGAATAPQAVQLALDLARRLGKEPIVVRDSPGFASSRLGLVLGLEAMRMLEQGVASAEDIDRAMTLGYRHPMGPLRLTDLVGLDVRLAIAETLYAELGSEAFRPPEILRRLVAEGRLGRKAGRGFFDWSGGASRG